MIVDHGFQRRLLYFEILSGGLHRCEKYIIFHKREIALKGQALIQITKNVTNRKVTKPLTLNKLPTGTPGKRNGTRYKTYLNSNI